MDPITIIGLVASVAGLVHASRTTVEIIKTFKDGNKLLFDLSNDLVVFAEALTGFERVLRSRATLHRVSGSAIDSVLENSANTIKDLEQRLKQITRSEVNAVRRAKLVHHSSKIERLHARLKEQSAMLQTFLSITHAETFFAIASQYPQYMLHRDSGEEHRGEEETNRLRIPDSGINGRRLSAASSSATTVSVTETTSSIEPISAVSSVTSSGSVLSASRKTSQPPAPRDTQQISKDPSLVAREITEPLSGTGWELTQDSEQETLEIRQACRYDCYCECHKLESMKPRRGFAKLKSAKLQCSDPTCWSNMKITGNYAKQSVSFREALIQTMSAKNIKFAFNMNTYRMVPEGSEAMRHVKHGNLEKLRACIESGEATKWDTAPDGWSLLHTAAYNRQLPIVNYLVGLGVDTEVGDVGSRKPIDLAILKSIGEDATNVERDIVEAFSEKDDHLSDFEFTPIHIAVLEIYGAKDSERPSLTELIKVVDDANNAPTNTDWAAWKRRFRGRSPLFADVIEYFRASAFEQPKGKKIMHNLLDRKDKKFSWTPLHWAASAGQSKKMRVLVNHGADPTILSNLNANILHAAAESKTSRGLAGALDIWKHFSDQLDINQANKWAETPLHVAAWCSPACVQLLLEAGADPNIKEENGQVPLHCAGLTTQGPARREIISLLCGTQNKMHINTQDRDGRPPIFEFLDDCECIKMLRQHGARLDLTDDSGKNIIHHACIQDESEGLTELLRLAGGNAAVAVAKNHDGNSPLIEALSNSSINCAMILLKLEDVGDIIGGDGWAAVHYAVKIGDADLLEAVFQHPSFMKGMKTMDGKRADVVAMEAGNWHGRFKNLIREHDNLAWRKDSI